MRIVELDENWKKYFSNSITKPEQILQKFKVDVQSIKKVVAQYPMRISKYYFDLIQDIEDPIWKQCIPNFLELQDVKGFQDPLSEEAQSPTRGLVHRYPDRALMCVSNNCATYCRFCTRKRIVGKTSVKYSNDVLLNQIRYIKETPSIRDVLLSGGDPLLLPEKELDSILKKVRSSSHVEIVRLGSRIPCTLPAIITPKLCKMLKKYHPLYLNVHFNHPQEITEESERACGLLADAGIPLGNQSVLLKGVNDDVRIMKDLVQKLLKIRVKPYYLFQMDLVKGTYHFRTRVETGIKIIEALTGYTSGFAVPRYVIDSPNGGGKIPIQQEHIIAMDDHKVLLKNYEGKIITYPQIPLTKEPLPLSDIKHR